LFRAKRSGQGVFAVALDDQAIGEQAGQGPLALHRFGPGQVELRPSDLLALCPAIAAPIAAS